MSAAELLSAEQLSTLMMLEADSIDEAMRARVPQLIEANKAAQQTLPQVKPEGEGIAADLAEARHLRAAAAEDLAKVEARSGSLDAREQGMAEVLTSLNTEKDAFNKIRAQVEAGHAERHETLKAREAEVAEREKALATSETQLAEGQVEIAGLKSDLEAKHERLHVALVANRADEPESAAAT